MTFSKTITGNSGDESIKNFQAFFSGSDIPDGKYKISLSAKKNISAAYGYRESNLENENSENGEIKVYEFTYKYPVPQPSFTSLSNHFFKIDFDSNTNRHTAKYALDLNYIFDSEKILNGVKLNVNENNGTKLDTKDFRKNFRFNTHYIPSLSKDGPNSINFDLEWHDDVDKYKRTSSHSQTVVTPSINPIKKAQYTEVIDLDDPIDKSFSSTWKELNPLSSNSNFKEENYSYNFIKNNTLPYIPRNKRVEYNFNGINYRFFFRNEEGPFYRLRHFQKNDEHDNVKIKRYDSVPFPINTNISNWKELLPISENFIINEIKTSYSKSNNTMNLEFYYVFKDVDGTILTSDKIDYAIFTVYNREKNETFREVDIKNKDVASGKSNIVLQFLNIPIGVYGYSLKTYNEACDSDSNTMMSTSDIILKPDANDCITSSYNVLNNSTNVSKRTLRINWNVHLTNLSSLQLHIIKENGDHYTTWKNTQYNNATIDEIDPGTYKYYFTFNSPDCIFNSSRVGETTISIS